MSPFELARINPSGEYRSSYRVDNRWEREGLRAGEAWAGAKRVVCRRLTTRYRGLVSPITCRVDGHEADNRCNRRFRLNEPRLPGRDTANRAAPPCPTSVARSGGKKRKGNSSRRGVSITRRRSSLRVSIRFKKHRINVERFENFRVSTCESSLEELDI